MFTNDIAMDGILDIIIAVLFIAIPAIFKAIGNKLEKSGSGKAGKFKQIAEKIEGFNKPEEDADDEKADPSDEEGSFWEVIKKEWTLEQAPEEPAAEIQEVFTAPEVVVRQSAVTKRPEHLKPTNQKPAILIEDEPKKKGEKIDPKKLVIYSEIMKPKF